VDEWLNDHLLRFFKLTLFFVVIAWWLDNGMLRVSDKIGEEKSGKMEKKRKTRR